jgi:hypothetical protein
MRLMLDAAVSFAFVPTFEIGAFALTWWLAGRCGSFRKSARIFLEGDRPWLIWLAIMTAVVSVIAPLEIVNWTEPQRFRLGVASAVPFALWSARIDFYYFQQVLGRSRNAAAFDVFLQRAIAWGAGLIYFFALAIPPTLMSIVS